MARWKHSTMPLARPMCTFSAVSFLASGDTVATETLPENQEVRNNGKTYVKRLRGCRRPVYGHFWQGVRGRFGCAQHRARAAFAAQCRLYGRPASYPGILAGRDGHGDCDGQDPGSSKKKTTATRPSKPARTHSTRGTEQSLDAGKSYRHLEARRRGMEAAPRHL